MPNRILREDILTSERVNSLKGDEELFFRRLMSVVDDYGRIEVHSKILLTRCYPLQMDRVIESQIRQWLVILEDRKLVTIYEVSGKRYLEMYNFGQRKRHSKYPDPPKSQQLAGRALGNDTSGHEAGLETTQAGLEAEGARLQPSSHSPSTSPSNSISSEGTIPILQTGTVDLALVVPKVDGEPLFQNLIGCFLAAGVLLNESDRLAAATEWVTIGEEHWSRAATLAQAKAKNTEAKFMGLPATFLRKKEWTRAGPGRLLPEPARESKMDRSLGGLAQALHREDKGRLF